MKCSNSNKYLIKVLNEIKDKQTCTCENYCEQQLGTIECQFNTIPIMLLCKNSCDFYIGTGIFKDYNTNSFKCFKTPVFRVFKIDEENEIILLELLQPQTINGDISSIIYCNNACNFFSSVSISKFIRTGICINVDLNLFEGIECLDPICAKCEIPKGSSSNPVIIDVETSEYVTISDGIKKEYFNSDGITGYNIILNPSLVSYANLFVNGMLQPPEYYTYVEGKLTLNTDDIPISGSYIILQFIKIKK